ncbi:MAG: type II secretion system F family protein [Planctomycetaceae bacterium]|nr:type II secretion system F family protein [Planctomycetaceae bacterium]
MTPISLHFETLAATSTDQMILLVGCALMGLGACFLVRTLLVAMASDDLQQDDDWRYDVSRINELRRASTFYRVFQPLIQLLATPCRNLFRDGLPEVNREIQTSGECRFWIAEEYLARNVVISVLMFPVYFYVNMTMMGTAGWFLALVMTLLTGVVLRRRLSHNSAYRLLRIKRRLPYFLDLITLLMEAGSAFMQAMEQAVREFSDHPVGVEFSRVLTEMRMGKNRTAAFQAMRDRLQDDEITSLLGSIIQGEELGTPLATIFRSQADVLRLKRSQRAETLANEAGVKMLLPAVLVMLSTVIVILGPFVLNFLLDSFSL